MAKQVHTITTVVDDLDGTTIEDDRGETISFGLDGDVFEIDLGDDNAAALRRLLEPYVQAARVVSRAPRSRASAGNTSSQELTEARAWLRDHGHPVADRGRIARHLMELYRASR